jgi:hypothetical protein
MRIAPCQCFFFVFGFGAEVASNSFGFWICNFAGYNCETITYKATKLQSELAIACSLLSESWLKISFSPYFLPNKSEVSKSWSNLGYF